jgi:transketolase
MALTACEQIRTDCAYTKQKVRLIAHHAGISMGFYGTSHHATEDLSILRAMPDITIICPADGNATDSAIRATVDLEGPIYFRLGRGKSDRVYDTPPEYRLGKANLLQEGSDLTIIANGILAGPALQAAQDLAREGVSLRVLDLHTIKPFDDDAVLAAARETGGILTVEEHNVIGGLGSCVADVLADNGVATKLRRPGIKDEYVLVGPPLALYAHYGLDREGITKRVREVLAEG